MEIRRNLSSTYRRNTHTKSTWKCRGVPIELNATNTDFSSIEIWFTVQNSKPLEIEDNVNLSLIIGRHYKK